jgi:hypothetical protein
MAPKLGNDHLDADTRQAIVQLKEHSRNRGEQWVIFLGAGASVAAGYPTMAQMLSKHVDSLSLTTPENKLVANIFSALKDRGSKARPPRSVTIEDVLRELYQLTNVVEGKPDVSIVYKKDPRVTAEMAQRAIQGIKSSCKKECSSPPKTDELCDFLSFWMSAHREIRIFTTNWDSSVEMACDQILADGIYDVRLCDGFKGNKVKLFDSELFQESSTDSTHTDIRIIRLYKLHGSVDWDMRLQPKEGMNLRSNKVDADQEVMIFPTPRKHGEVLGYPYIELHRFFADALAGEAKYMLAIGTSFPDEHINTVVAGALRRESFNLFVVDPALTKDDVESRLGMPGPRIHPVMKLEFGRFVAQLKKGE